MANAEIEACAAGHTALLIIDMITDMKFSQGDRMLPAALAAGERIAKLRAAATKAGVPTVYVNDNFGQWHSERSRIIAHMEGSPAHELVERLRPRDDDFFVIKPQFSGFYATNLPVLLPKLGASRLILTGIAADICVLFTAADAHMREYALWVPSDCVASHDEQRTRWALEIMQHSMSAEVASSEEMTIADWLAHDAGRAPPGG